MTRMRLSFLATFACLTLCLLLGGCGHGSGQGLDESGNMPSPVSDTGGDSGSNGDTGNGSTATSGNPDATLAWAQANVFGGVCSQCHTGAGAPLGVDWSSEAASCDNVGRTSGEISSMMEVESGDPAASYMIWKVEGAGPDGEAIVGVQMPLSNPPLSVETIQNLKDWVADGVPGCPL